MKNTAVIILNLLITSHQVAAEKTIDSNAEVVQSEVKVDELGFEILDQINLPPAEAVSITVIVEKKQTIEEYRQKGELVLIKVIPNEGVSYFIDPLERDNLKGSGRDLINSGISPVRWVVKEF